MGKDHKVCALPHKKTSSPASDFSADIYSSRIDQIMV